jgi:hypothetical protein
LTEQQEQELYQEPLPSDDLVELADDVLSETEAYDDDFEIVHVQVVDEQSDEVDLAPSCQCGHDHEPKEDPRFVDLSSGKRGRGRPRKPGRNARIHLVYDKDGEIRFSTESWKSGPYGFNKAIKCLEWSREQGLTTDFLVVADPATLKMFDLRQVKIFPIARRGQPFPTTVEDWEEYLKVSESLGKEGDK